MDSLQQGIIKYYPEIIQTALDVRQRMVSKYGPGTDLCGRCIEASDLIVTELRNRYNITTAKTVEGYCWFELGFEGCSDNPYDGHTWVQIYGLSKVGKRVVYLDVTADQFNLYLEKEFDGVVVGEKPACMHKGKPNTQHLKDIGWW